MTTSQQNWIAVACAQHVVRGRERGIMQVCHGRAAALKRIRTGDRIIYYSPTMTFGGREKCQNFTAMGIVRDEHVYEVDMGDGFRPFRREVKWWKTVEVSIHPLRPRLELTRDKPNWGYAFRYGLLTISEHDIHLIAEAMASASVIR